MDWWDGYSCGESTVGSRQTLDSYDTGCDKALPSTGCKSGRGLAGGLLYEDHTLSKKTKKRQLPPVHPHVKNGGGKSKGNGKRKKMYNNAMRAMLPSPNLPSRPQISVAPPLMPVTSIPHVPRQRPSPAKITPGRCTVWFVQSRCSSRRGGQERRAVVAEEGLTVLWGLL